MLCCDEMYRKEILTPHLAGGLKMDGMLFFLFLYSFVVAAESRTVYQRNPMENHDLFEGDIVVMSDITPLRSAVPKDSQLWPRGIIPYVIDSGLESKSKNIESAMRHIEKKTCIKFTRRTSESAYVRIFGDDEGCYSYFGKAGIPQPLSLGDGCFDFGTIVHELSHAVGLLHEHNRSDRDNFIEIIWTNIDPDFEEEFIKYLPQQNRLINSFDYTSIMMYGEKAFSLDGVSKTMKATKHGVRLVEVSDKLGLSASDVFRINKLYKC